MAETIEDKKRAFGFKMDATRFHRDHMLSIFKTHETKFLELAQNPDLGKKLEGELRDFYSLRVWPYRIIYQIIKNELIVFVVQIKHRQGVY